MSNLPTEEKIRQNTDVRSLQDACITLIELYKKEDMSKKQYRAKASEFKQQLAADQIVIQSLQEKNRTLEEISRQIADEKSSTSKSSDLNDVIKKLEGEIKELKQNFEQSQKIINNQNEQIENLEIEKKELTSKISNYEFVMKQQSNEIQIIKSQISPNENARPDSNSNSNQKVDQELFSAKQQIQELNIELQRLHTQISEKSSVISEKENENKQLSAEKQKLFEESNQKQDLLNQSNEKVEELSKKVADLNEKVDDYQKSIEKFQIEKDSLIQITESNKNKAKERIEKLKSANLQQFEQHREENRKNEEEIQKLQNQISSLNEKLSEFSLNQEKLNEFENEKLKLKQIINQQETQLNDIQKEYNFVLKQIQTYKIIENENQEQKTEIEELKNVIQKNQKELFQSTLTIKECEKAVRDIQGTIDDRDSTIIKLKNLLTRSNKSDKRKQQQIDDLQNYIQTVQNNGYQFDEIEKLTNEKEELEEKLRKSQASDELFQQNQKLQEANDRTSQLYSQLLEDHLKLVKEATFRSDVNLSISRDSIYFENWTEIEEIEEENEKVAPKSRHNSFNESESANMKKETKLARSAYLRRVLLQFFSEENDTERAEMVPIILELVGCSNEQVSIVMRHLQRNQHLIARTAGFFGY